MEFGSGIVLNLVDYKCSVGSLRRVTARSRVQIAYFYKLLLAHGARVLGTVTSDTEIYRSNPEK